MEPETLKAPAFQFYADDFIGGTLTMSHEERGLYILALCIQWGQGSLAANDIEHLGSGMAEPSLSKVRAKFEVCADGRLRQRRMEKEREKQALYRAERAESGKKGAKARWEHGSANGSAIKEPMAKGMANDGSPSPSPSPSPLPTSEDRVSGLAPPAHTPPATPEGAAKKAKKPTQTDDEWISGIEAMDAYKPVNVRQELGKAQLWCSNKNRQCTRIFFTNWLNRALGNVKTISTTQTPHDDKYRTKYGW